MNLRSRHHSRECRVLTARGAALIGILLAGAATAQGGGDTAKPAAVDPKGVWPASLGQLAGRYLYAQVGSPGGLWMRPSNGTARQVAIDDAPAALQKQLRAAELVIGSVAAGTDVSASERPTPSGRGRLRFYSEEGAGRLTMRNLPGISGGGKVGAAYSGQAVFRLEHVSHSNPSPLGIFQTRQKEEMTWGAATIDYADLYAYFPDTPQEHPGAGKPAPAKKPAAGTPTPKPPAGVGAKPAAPPDDSELEGNAIISNARVLRSGREIFAYVDWTEKLRGVEKRYTGSIRLVRR